MPFDGIRRHGHFIDFVKGNERTKRSQDTLPDSYPDKSVSGGSELSPLIRARAPWQATDQLKQKQSQSAPGKIILFHLSEPGLEAIKQSYSKQKLEPRAIEKGTAFTIKIVVATIEDVDAPEITNEHD